MHQQDTSRPGQPRMIVLFVLLALLMTSGYINYKNAGQQSTVSGTLPVVRIVTDAPSAQPSASAAPTPQAVQSFADLKTERANQRAQEMEMLDGILEDTSSSAEIIAQAQSQKLELIKSMDAESTLEGLLSARGFEKALAYVGAASVTLVIPEEELTQTQLTQILDLAVRETGVQTENVKIIARK